MRNRLTGFLILSIVVLQISINAFALPNNQVLIRFKDTYKESDINKFIKEFNLKKVKVLSGLNIHVLEVPKNIKSEQLVKKVGKVGIVKYVEENTQVDLTKDFTKTTEKLDYTKILGKEITITGIYESSRAGAMFSNDNGSISLIDLDNRVLLKLPNIKEGSSLKLTGIVRKIKGYNVTNDMGLLVINIEELIK